MRETVVLIDVAIVAEKKEEQFYTTINWTLYYTYIDVLN